MNNNSFLLTKLDKLNQKFLTFSHKFDSYTISSKSSIFKHSHKLFSDYGVLFTYLVFMSIISFFHEPWGDEAQSWAIAKYASYNDMLFTIGHGEGHPALWWVYLSIFAKSGFPFEFGLKVASIILNAIFCWLLIFKVKIPRLMRYSIPFTYFFFYQYGVISRCYSILIVAMLILSIYWNHRYIKPYRTVCALILLCLSSAYGIAISFVLASIWLVEIVYCIIRYKNNLNIKNQVIALFILLICASIIVLLIIPTKNAYALNIEEKNTFLFRIFYMLIIEPIDSLFFMAVYIDTELFKFSPDLFTLIIGSFISILFHTIIFLWPKAKGMRRFLILPHILISFIASYSFYYSHHFGITTSLYLFWYIICYTNENPLQDNTLTKSILSSKINILKSSFWIIPSLIIVVSLKWTIESSILEIKYNYSAYRSIYNKLSDLGFQDYKILANNVPMATSYFGNNENIYQLKINNQLVSYTINNLTNAQIDEYVNYWSKIGWPDIYFGDSSTVFGKLSQCNPSLKALPHYSILLNVKQGMIFKGEYDGIDGWTDLTVYIRDDLKP